MGARLQRFRQYLMSGVSHVIPFVACGGILIAAAIALAPMRPGLGPDFSGTPVLSVLNTIGSAAFSLVVPVLAGYIAHGMADRPGLVPGFVAGVIAQSTGAGFLGGIAGGLLAGGVVMGLKRLPVHRYVRPIMPILIIPVLSSLVVGGAMQSLLGTPIKMLMTSMSHGLHTLGQGNQAILGLVIGAMMAFDMGGPVNKVAFFFGVAMIGEGNPRVMGAVAAAAGVPPLGLGLATRFAPRRWSSQERDSGLAALAMGLIGITEGAIPFAAADPLRVIPCIMAGGALSGAMALMGGVMDHAPHGGPIVLPVVDHRVWYLISIAAGSLLVALLANVLRGRQQAASNPRES